MFHKDADYEAFVNLFDEAHERSCPMRILAFCLMPNHFHVVLWPHADGDVSRWMQWTHARDAIRATQLSTEEYGGSDAFR